MDKASYATRAIKLLDTTNDCFKRLADDFEDNGLATPSFRLKLNLLQLRLVRWSTAVGIDPSDRNIPKRARVGLEDGSIGATVRSSLAEIIRLLVEAMKVAGLIQSASSEMKSLGVSSVGDYHRRVAVKKFPDQPRELHGFFTWSSRILQLIEELELLLPEILMHLARMDLDALTREQMDMIGDGYDEDEDEDESDGHSQDDALDGSICEAVILTGSRTDSRRLHLTGRYDSTSPKNIIRYSIIDAQNWHNRLERTRVGSSRRASPPARDLASTPLYTIDLQWRDAQRRKEYRTLFLVAEDHHVDEYTSKDFLLGMQFLDEERTPGARLFEEQALEEELGRKAKLSEQEQKQTSRLKNPPKSEDVEAQDAQKKKERLEKQAAEERDQMNIKMAKMAEDRLKRQQQKDGA